MGLAHAESKATARMQRTRVVHARPGWQRAARDTSEVFMKDDRVKGCGSGKSLTRQTLDQHITAKPSGCVRRLGLRIFNPASQFKPTFFGLFEGFAQFLQAFAVLCQFGAGQAAVDQRRFQG